MWAQIINAALGIALMAAPGVLGLSRPASDNFYIFGPVITTFAVIAWWEATRSMRYWNLGPAAWLVVSPLILGFESTAATLTAVGIGLVVGAFSLVRGKVEKRYGGGWTALWSDDPAHEDEALARHPRSS